MFSSIFVLALAASPLVAAHGRVDVITGDAGGNTTGLGIQGGIVPGAGSNSKTEVDTTVFNNRKALTDGLGKTTGGGANQLSDLSTAMALSGSTLPQVSEGGSISGTIHIVTTDGAGPYTAVVDPTGTGKFSQGTVATVTTQVPGRNGNIAAPRQRRFIPRMLVKMGLVKRARNVNEDYPFSATIPAGTTCSGTVAGQSNVCLVKLVNPSGAGPFGGVIAIQMAGAGAAAGAGNSSTADTGSTAGSAANGAAAAAVPSSVGAGSQTAAAEEAKKGGAAGKALRPKPVGAKFRA